jgi:hypothetical protein
MALFNASGSENSVMPVVSELELTQPETLEKASPQPSPAPKQQAHQAEVIAPVAEVVDREPVLLGSPVLKEVTVAAAPSGVSERGDAAGEAPRRSRGAGPIIIRGGVSGRDPCAIHLPGQGDVLTARGGGARRGGISVLINDRRPPGIGVGNPSFPNQDGIGVRGGRPIFIR